MFGTIILFLIIYYFFSLIFSPRRSSAEQMSGPTYTYGQSRRENFITALLVLIAEVMKADGVVKRVELDYVKQQLVTLLGYDAARLAILQLRDILKFNQDINQVIQTVRFNIDYDSKLTILHILYGIAKADGNVSDGERELIRRIGIGIGLSRQDTESIIHTYSASNDIGAAYKVLEIDQSATDEEVKKAYRVMAMKYHPDKVATLGREIVANAEIKFKQVQDAYEKIKTARGMK